MKDFNIFKVEYDWVEDDHGEIIVGKRVEIAEFEKDLTEAKKFAESLIGKEVVDHNYLGKGYSVECLPEFYEQIIWYLTDKLGYTVCEYDLDIAYRISDDFSKRMTIRKSEKKIEWKSV